MKKTDFSSIWNVVSRGTLLQTFVFAALLTALASCQMPSPAQSGGSSGMPSSPSSPGSPGSPGSNDSLGDLDQSLDDSLDDFDSTVAGQGSSNKPAQIDILSPSGASSIESDSDQRPYESAESIAEGDSDIEERAATGPDSDSDGEGGGDGSGGGGQSSGNNSSESGEAIVVQPLPDDIDDGQGDDIVLRQIRAAATQESDPALREKLWDEYRRIKNGN